MVRCCSLPLLIGPRRVGDAPVAQLRRYWSLPERAADEQRDGGGADSRLVRVTPAGVAVVAVRGILAKFRAWPDEVSSAEISQLFRSLAARDDLAGVLLVIDSPGGSVEGQSELIDAALELSAVHRVHVHVDDVCASAAYWLACCARTISANELSVVGSVGCFSVVYDLSRAYSEAGIVTHLVSSGDLKGSGAAGAEIDEDAIAQWRRLVDGVADEFVTFVRRSRPSISRSAWDEISRGGVFTARDALSLGLIDRVSSLSDAIANAESSASAQVRRRRLKTLKMASATLGENHG